MFRGTGAREEERKEGREKEEKRIEGKNGGKALANKGEEGLKRGEKKGKKESRHSI